MIRVALSCLACAIVIASSLAAPEQSVPQGKPPAPEFRFEYATDPAGAIRQVLVYRDKVQIQALDSCTGQAVPRANGLGELWHPDFNFDGYSDLMMRVSFDPITGNSSYCIWLYDPKTQTFVLSDELSHLINPQPDPDNKTVVAGKKILCSRQCYVVSTYKWSNGHLRLVREESLMEDPVVAPESDCRWVWAVKRERKGKLVENRDRVDSAGLRCEPHTAVVGGGILPSRQ